MTHALTLFGKNVGAWVSVLIHSAEPVFVLKPKDKYNERWLELKQKPNRYRDPEKVPSFESILAEQHHVFEKHPTTTFINAHLGWMGNDLDRLGAHLTATLTCLPKLVLYWQNWDVNLAERTVLW